MTAPTYRRFAALALLLLPALFAACRGTGRLEEYDFSNRTLAVRTSLPPQPAVLTGPWFFNWDNDPVKAIIRAGTRIAKEVEASEVRARLDSAAAMVDIAGRVSDRALDRAAFHLRAEPADNGDAPDFLVEILVREYGIDAEDWHAAAHFYVEAQLYLIDGRDGTQIWDTKVKSRDRMAPAVYGPGVVRDIVTARALAAQSVEEIAQSLERLADYSADRITERLREAMEKVQKKRMRY